MSGSGTMNVAYDLWLHNESNPGSSSGPSDEIMIWPYRSGGAVPAGTYQATVNTGGGTWDLYRGWIDAGNSGKYLSSVQAGTEVFTGSGSLDTNSYWVDVQ